eukprot:CAMPEP_0167740918 /NCGR_PEP_ID=MMETSP0110_2-20121227/560_1 /TAXON_ID=629695 /ORGANISM="Gymnochlora sp., Strain CCMP2014" /LENGTH=141 /DNA_ID=CAMNT_0007624897 /DNA_START=156 /DNA_END=581 /DNA_ORIENTATION=+
MKGDADGQYWLAKCFQYGYGTRRDYYIAAKWYQTSAENGNVFGQRRLAECYYYGCGVDKSYEKAVEWFYKAADQGEKFAKEKLDWILQEKPEISESLKEVIDKESHDYSMKLRKVLQRDMKHLLMLEDTILKASRKYQTSI